MGAYLRRVGIDELWVLEACDEPNAAGRKVRTRKIEGQWWEAAFWKGTPVEDGAPGQTDG